MMTFLASWLMAAQTEIQGVDLGWDGAAASGFAIWTLIVRSALFPLVRLRRVSLVDGESGERTGAYLIPEQLHDGIVLTLTVVVFAGAAVAMGHPIFPLVSSGLAANAAAMHAFTTQKSLRH